MFKPGRDRVLYCQAVYGKEEISAVVAALKLNWLGPGPLTEKFEKQIAKLFGKKYALFVNSGSSANLVAAEIACLPPQSEVITQACTFPTTLSPIIIKGLTPVFVDSKVGTYNIDEDQIEMAIGKKTRAIFISHALGNINNLDKIRKISARYNLVFIEDSCDTIGSQFAGKPTGAYSDITTASFYAAHHLTAAGSGGMVMTNSLESIREAKIFRDWGRALPENDDTNINLRYKYKLRDTSYDGKFTYFKLGFNFKPIELQAAFALEQLKKLAHFNKIRQRNFNRLYSFFTRYEEFFILPQAHPASQSFWLAFPLTIRSESTIDRKDLIYYLEKNKIQTRLVFSGNILYHKAYQNIKHRIYGSLTNADTIMRQSFVIGCHHGLTPRMIDYVCEVFENYFKKPRKRTSLHSQ